MKVEPGVLCHLRWVPSEQVLDYLNQGLHRYPGTIVLAIDIDEEWVSTWGDKYWRVKAPDGVVFSVREDLLVPIPPDELEVTTDREKEKEHEH